MVKPLFPRFDRVFAKLRAWQLGELDKVVLLDADTIVLSNVDDLFERPQISAAPSMWWRLYYTAHPQAGTRLRNKLHALEDWTYERVLDIFIR